MRVGFLREVLEVIRGGSAAEKAEQRGGEAAGSKKAERFFASVHAEQVGEEGGTPAEGMESARKERRVAVHEKEQVRHQARKSRYSRVCVLILREVFS
jgi:hypothetical protein